MLTHRMDSYRVRFVENGVIITQRTEFCVSLSLVGIITTNKINRLKYHDVNLSISIRQ